MLLVQTVEMTIFKCCKEYVTSKRVSGNCNQFANYYQQKTSTIYKGALKYHWITEYSTNWESAGKAGWEHWEACKGVLRDDSSA